MRRHQLRVFQRAAAFQISGDARDGCGRDDYSGWWRIPLKLFALMWSRPDILGLFSINEGPFSPNVVLIARYSQSMWPTNADVFGRGDLRSRVATAGVE